MKGPGIGKRTLLQAAPMNPKRRGFKNGSTVSTVSWDFLFVQGAQAIRHSLQEKRRSNRSSQSLNSETLDLNTLFGFLSWRLFRLSGFGSFGANP